MLGIGDSTASYIVKVSDFSCHLTLSPVIVTDIIMSGSFYTICSMHGSTSPVNSCYAHCLYIMVHKGQMGGGGGRSNGWSYFSYMCLGMVWCIVTQ